MRVRGDGLDVARFLRPEEAVEVLVKLAIGSSSQLDRALPGDAPPSQPLE